MSGDSEAWRVLFRSQYPVAAAFLRRLGVGSTELEDACQEVFVQLFRYLPTFRGEAELKTWLFRLCATEARKMRRHFRVTHSAQERLRRESAARAAAVDGPVLSDELARRKVEQALATLTPGERLVFVLFEMKGLPGDQVAAIAGCPVATVWRRLHHARRTFEVAVTGGNS